MGGNEIVISEGKRFGVWMMREGEKPWIDKEEVSKVHNRDWRR